MEDKITEQVTNAINYLHTKYSYYGFSFAGRIDEAESKALISVTFKEKTVSNHCFSFNEIEEKGSLHIFVTLCKWIEANIKCGNPANPQSSTIYVVQRRNIIAWYDESNEWENKKAFISRAKAFKYIQTVEPSVKKATHFRKDYRYVGDKYEWQIEAISLVE